MCSCRADWTLSWPGSSSERSEARERSGRAGRRGRQRRLLEDGRRAFVLFSTCIAARGKWILALHLNPFESEAGIYCARARGSPRGWVVFQRTISRTPMWCCLLCRHPLSERERERNRDSENLGYLPKGLSLGLELSLCFDPGVCLPCSEGMPDWSAEAERARPDAQMDQPASKTGLCNRAVGPRCPGAGVMGREVWRAPPSTSQARHTGTALIREMGQSSCLAVPSSWEGQVSAHSEDRVRTQRFVTRNAPTWEGRMVVLP